MKITAIKQQLKRAGRYSIFVEGKYAFSLSDTALLDSKLVTGQDLSRQEMAAYKKLSDDDKLYSQVLNYLTIRQRSRWEVETYLKRKQVSPALSEEILNKLSINEMIDDDRFARAWIADRQLLRPTSRRKLILELKQKNVKESVIQEVMSDLEPESEQLALLTIVETKRKQARYKDDLKLMQYLARQGFNYGDIKEALSKESS